MTYRKIGGLHFVRIGSFGFSFFWSRSKRRNVSALNRAWLATTEWCNR